MCLNTFRCNGGEGGEGGEGGVPLPTAGNEPQGGGREPSSRL